MPAFICELPTPSARCQLKTPTPKCGGGVELEDHQMPESRLPMPRHLWPGAKEAAAIRWSQSTRSWRIIPTPLSSPELYSTFRRDNTRRGTENVSVYSPRLTAMFLHVDVLVCTYTCASARKVVVRCHQGRGRAASSGSSPNPRGLVILHTPAQVGT